MSKAYPSHDGTGNSGMHPRGESGAGGKRSPSGSMEPQPHDIPSTVGGVHAISGPTLTGGNVGPLNAAVYDEEKAEGDSGSL